MNTIFTSINIKLKVSGGIQTPIEVLCELTTKNKRILKFKNGKTVSDVAIAVWVEEKLREMLLEVQLSDSEDL